MKNFIRIIVTMLTLVTLIPLNVQAKAKSDIYPMTTVVINYADGVLYCEDFNGNIWTIENEEEDWYIGDICAMVMNKNGTDIIYDDTIVTYKYDGFISEWGYWSDGNGNWGFREKFH